MHRDPEWELVYSHIGLPADFRRFKIRLGALSHGHGDLLLPGHRLNQKRLPRLKAEIEQLQNDIEILKEKQITGQ